MSHAGFESCVWESEDGSKADVRFVPPLQRRRLTGVERAAMAVLNSVWRDGDDMPIVFASRWGEIGTTLKLMKQMHEEGEMSPAGFSASVHNAFPGAFSLFKGSKSPYTAIAARGESLKEGLVEALSQLKDLASRRTGAKVAFVYAEEATPEMYRPSFGDINCACAVAVILDGSALAEGCIKSLVEAAQRGFRAFAGHVGAKPCQSAQ